MATVNYRSWTNDKGKQQERWDVLYRVNGKQRQKTFADKEAANEFAEETSVDSRRGDLLDPRGSKLRVEEYGYQWLEAKGFPPGTYQQVKMRLEVHVFPVIGKLTLQRANAMAIRSWLSKLPGAEDTKSVIFIHVNDIFQSAVDDGLLKENPCKKPSVQQLKPRSPIRPVRNIWSADQVNRQRDAIVDHYRIVVTLGSQIGLRPGEILGLSPWDVDFLRGVVHVRREVLRLTDGRKVFKRPKYNKTRDVPLFEGARDLLSAHLARFPAREVTLPWGDPDAQPNAKRRRGADPQLGELVTVPLVVTTTAGNAVDLSAFNTGPWRTALRRAGIEYVPRKSGPHHCRHYFCSTMLAVGYSPPQVCEFAGHADPAFTMRRYGHVVVRPDEAVLRRRLAEFHRGSSDGDDAFETPKG